MAADAAGHDLAAAYAGLSAGYADDLGALRPVPVANLLPIAIGLPAVAAAAAWLVGGKEPPSVSRTRSSSALPQLT